LFSAHGLHTGGFAAPAPPAPLGADDIHLWRARAGALRQTLPLDCIDDAERTRAGRLRLPAHRDAFLFAHALLRTVLGAYLARPPGQLAFARAAGGKPSLADQSLQFNLSHSADAVLIAVARSMPVGVDLEERGRRIDEAALACACLSQGEMLALDAMPAARRKRALLRQWTRKEALLKALGSGLADDPRLLALPLGTQALHGHAVSNASQLWRLSDLDLGESWAASLAFAGPPATIRGFCLGW
jgi:4'-phosphopantetheinyl transferase